MVKPKYNKKISNKKLFTLTDYVLLESCGRDWGDNFVCGKKGLLSHKVYDIFDSWNKEICYVN